jgi:plasmid stabilization system protein ParE
MAKRKRIVWTPQAKIDRYDILKFYAETGVSVKTLRKIDSQFKLTIKHLSIFPNLGKTFGIQNERIIYKGNYCMIYKILEEIVQIIQIWDTRRNPADFNIER